MPLLETEESLRAALGRSRAIVVALERDRVIVLSEGARGLVADRPDASAEMRRILESMRANGGAGETRFEATLKDATGAERRVEFEVARDRSDSAAFVLAIGHDVTDSRARESELAKRALTDALTGLPNRTLLADRIGQALLLAERQSRSTALIVFDLDGFKSVNDAHGHAAGDALLREVSERTRAELRESDTVARLGGDEFAVLLPPPGDVVSALATARKINEALGRPFAIDRSDIRIRASLGVALFPQHGRDAEALLDKADAAMYAAKSTGVRVVMYDPERDMRSARVLAELEEIGAAISKGELDLHYQPAVRLRDGRALRAEAFVRWVHGSRGLLRPAAFVPLAERSGLGPALGAWVLHQALQRCRAWRDAGTDAGICVNVGLRDLFDSALPARVAEELSAARLDPRALTIDINEAAFGDDAARLERPIRELAKVGVRLALDDFGSGSGSLKLLRRLPLAEVKLDARFVGEVCTNLASWSFVRSGIDAAHALGLEVSAEGVEDEATAYVLGRLGCDVAQGHYLTSTAEQPGFGFLRGAELDAAALN